MTRTVVNRLYAQAVMKKEVAAAAEAMRAKCEAIAQEHLDEARDREYLDLVIQAQSIADAIAALKR